MRQGTVGYGIFLVLLTGIVALFAVHAWRARPTHVVTHYGTPPVVVATDPTMGDATAPVTIIEFGDYACPSCKGAQPILHVLLAKYRGQIRVVWKDLPLTDQHPEARNAAEAARCAQQQNAFWEMNSALFDHQSELGAALYTSLAKTLGLNETAFTQCMESHTTQPLISQSQDGAALSGVDGTPYFFINTIPFAVEPTQEKLEQAIALAQGRSAP